MSRLGLGQSLEPMKEDIKTTSSLQSTQFAIHTEGGEGLEREQDCVVCCDCCPSI